MKVIFVRHGNTDYTKVDNRNFVGLGFDFVPLSEKGIIEIHEIKNDQRLLGAELLLSSPFTRTLQTAAIIGNEINQDITVEMDLHEWLPDRTFSYKSSEEGIDFYYDFLNTKGIHPIDRAVNWESFANVRKRILSVLNKYTHLNKIIVISHCIAMSSILDGSDPNFSKTIKNGAIVEYEYEGV